MPNVSDYRSPAPRWSWLAESEPLTALDWQHTAYRSVPGHQAPSDGPMAVPVLPDGDYDAHMAGDLRRGTFRHPWQQ